MDNKMLLEGPGFAIVRTYTAETLVPYFPAERPDGEMNYGWFDIRDRPELVTTIPEARKSNGLANILRVIAQPASKLMSGGCECHAFDNGSAPDRPRWQVGGYVTTMFKDSDANTNEKAFFDLACYILHGIVPTDAHHIGFEMIIEPLKSFFGRTDCLALAVKPLGYGPDETSAWAAFNHAATAMAESIQRARHESERIPLMP